MAVTVKVQGRVQGVGYRMSCATEAIRLGVFGWVRNEPDESVSGHFEGTPTAVDALVAWCRQGPRFSRVRSVTTMPASPYAATRFEVRY